MSFFSAKDGEGAVSGGAKPQYGLNEFDHKMKFRFKLTVHYIFMVNDTIRRRISASINVIFSEAAFCIYAAR